MGSVHADGSTPSLLSSWHARVGARHPLLWDGLLQLAFDHLQGAITRESRVVDIGCGQGHITQVFSEQGCRVMGIDVHHPTLRVLRESYPDIEIVTADAQRLPLEDQSVDVLFSFSTFQYVNRSRALEECSRVLRRGGRFAVIENLAGNPVAQAYRVWHRVTGRQFPEHLSPRNHLSWGERRQYEAHFSAVRYEALHLLTPMLLLLPAARGSLAGQHSGYRRVVRVLERLERGVVHVLPLARRACWHIVVCGVR